MAVSVLLLPAEVVQRVLGTPSMASRDKDGVTAQGASDLARPTFKRPQSAEEKTAWRKENIQRMAADMAPYASQHLAAKTGTWQDNEMVLSGLSNDLPHDSPQYMKLLVWLHLDPPSDAEVRQRLPRLLLVRVGTDALSLWGELLYPGSANADEIRNAARAAVNDSAFHWSDDDKKRLLQIAETELPRAVESAAVAH